MRLIAKIQVRNEPQNNVHHNIGQKSVNSQKKRSVILSYILQNAKQRTLITEIVISVRSVQSSCDTSDCVINVTRADRHGKRLHMSQRWNTNIYIYKIHFKYYRDNRKYHTRSVVMTNCSHEMNFVIPLGDCLVKIYLGTNQCRETRRRSVISYRMCGQLFYYLSCNNGSRS